MAPDGKSAAPAAAVAAAPGGAPDAYWQSLQYFNAYRTAVALLLLMADRDNI